MSGIHMTRKYCSIQLYHTIPSSDSAVFLLCVSTCADTHTHNQPTHSNASAHWQYQVSANNNVPDGIFKYLGLSKANYSHKWWKNNANLSGPRHFRQNLTPRSRVSQSI